jgi:O-antigen ligase
VTSLTGRDQLWREAISVWEESPLVGAGLASATRYDALEGIGRDTASTIHSTWVEALAGTGIFGVVLLASAYVVTFRRALGDHHAIPVIALTAIGVRSITGTSIELVSFQAVMFLIVMQWVSGASSRSVESVESGPVVRSQGDPHPRTLALSENRDRS